MSLIEKIKVNGDKIIAHDKIKAKLGLLIRAIIQFFI